MNTSENSVSKPLQLSVIVVAILFVAVCLVRHDWSGKKPVAPQPVHGTESAHTMIWDSQADFESGIISGLDSTTLSGQLQLPVSNYNFTENFSSTANYNSGASSQINWDTANNRLILPNAPSSMTDYSAALFAAWGTSNSVTALAQDGNTVYIGASSGKFAKIDLSTGTVTDLSATISAFWGGQNLSCLTYDGTNNRLYIGGSGGRFASFDGTTATNLTPTITGFWGANTVRAMDYVPSLDILYLSGDTARFATFDGTSATNLNALVSGIFTGGGIESLAFNTANNLLYLGGDNFLFAGKFASYDGSTVTDLSAEIAGYFPGQTISTLHFSPYNDTLYLGGGQPIFVAYDGATYTDYSSTLSFWGLNYFRDISEDPAGRRLFLSGDSSNFATFDMDSLVATDYSGIITGGWGVSPVYTVIVTGSENVMVGGPSSRLARINNDYASSGYGTTIKLNATSASIKNATLTATASAPGSTIIAYALSANGGANWEAVTPGVEHSFANVGNDLRLRMILSTTDPAVSPTISNAAVNFKTLTNTTGSVRLIFDAGQQVLYTGLNSAGNSPAGTGIEYRYRVADSRDNLNVAGWSEIITVMPYNLTASDQFIEIETVLISNDGINSPILESITADYSVITRDEPIVEPVEPVEPVIPVEPVTPVEPIINKPIIPVEPVVETGGDTTVGERIVTAITDTISVLAKPIEAFFGAIGISKEEAPVAMSTVAVATGGATAAMAPISNMVATSSSLPQTVLTFWNNFLAFLGIGQRRRRGKWGRVMEKGTELPIAGTKIHLIEVMLDDKGQLKTGRTLATTITDKDGDFGFVAEPGHYKLQIEKSGYEIVKEHNSYSPDQTFAIKSYNQGLVVPDIVMDLKKEEITRKFNRIVLWSKVERVLKYTTPVFLIFGTVVTVNAMLQHYSGKQWILSLVYIAFWIYWIFTEFVSRRRSPWGTVADIDNKSPLSLALVRVMDPTQKRLVRTAVTNAKGKYSVLVNKAEYSIVTYKSGYQSSQPMKINTKDKLSVINQSIKLKRS